MQDKLLNILKIRIDAINRNIDNLNYLNAELEKNTKDLNYIEEKIAIFKGGEILNFADLPREEFEKVLTMISPNVSDIFSDKTCNYQGIMYIIEGIKQGISLELTTEQENAIKTFIGEMINKKSSLEDVIANLNESKNKLPEVNMTNLTNSLKDYQTIISKIDDNLYVTEIGEIVETLDFANVSLEEKIGIFEFLLKYNADIYTSNQTPIETPIEDDFSLKEINVPEFHYEPINIYDNKDIEETKEEVSTPESEEAFDEKFEEIPLPSFEKDVKSLEEKVEEPLATTQELNDIIGKIDAKLKELDDEVKTTPAPKETEEIKLATLEPEVEEEVPLEEETKEIETEKEDIQKFEPEEEKEEQEVKEIEETPKEPELPPIQVSPVEIAPIEINVPSEEAEVPKELENEIKVTPIEKISESIEKPSEPEAQNQSSLIEEALRKYELEPTDFNINELKLENVEANLKTLKDNNILEDVKEHKNVLPEVVKVEAQELVNLIKTIKDNLGNDLKENIEIILYTMPLVFTKTEVMTSFIKNIEFFKEHKINLGNLFDNYKELLILNNEILLKNYKEVSGYGLELNNDNVKYLLYNTRLLENLDLYIEAKGGEKGFLGRESEFDGVEYITKNPYKLNYMSRDTLMKLRYQSENGGKIYGNKPGILSGEIANPKVDVLTLSSDYKGLYFDNEYNFIDRSELLSLIEEIKNLQEFNITPSGLIEKLDSKYKLDDMRYQIDNLVFSRIKTIRLYNFLSTKNLSDENALIIALTYNSVIKRDEYLKVEEAIKSLVGGN